MQLVLIVIRSRSVSMLRERTPASSGHQKQICSLNGGSEG